MRQIKFRGKRCSDGSWVYGSYLESNLSWHGHKPHKSWIVGPAFSNGGWLALMGRTAVKEETIGQFTGLKDKKGKEIYEGDILKNNLSEHPFAIVCWHQNGYFFCDCNMGRHPTDYECNEYTPLGEVLNFHIDSKKVEYEVIGNIYDNKELLNQ